MRRIVLVCLVLASLVTACATPRWVNPQDPGANLDADMSACDKDAERAARLAQLVAPKLAPSPMSASPTGSPLAQSASVQAVTAANETRQRCLVAKGWRPARQP